MPPTAGPAAPAKGRCGDGVCDDAERSDPELCPQDCAAVSSTASPAAAAIKTPAASGSPDYEPPINIFVILHIDPVGGMETDTYKVTPEFYQRTRDEIYWLMDEAKRHGVKLTALFNGWYTKWALEHDDLEQFRLLLEAGHEVGTHAHALTYDASQDAWVHQGDVTRRWGVPFYDHEASHQSWSDADQYMDAVFAAIGVSGQNRSMCAVPFLASNEGALMSEFGFSFASGNRSEKGPFYFGHMVWNPWRPASSDQTGEELLEDLKAGFVAVDHYAQIGAAEEEHASIDVTAAGVKRLFLMLYPEWLSRERRGADDKVWDFGFVYHPNYGDKYNKDLADALSWFDQYFVGQSSPHGHTIARYATVAETCQEYLEWEQAHPGVSSFSYAGRAPYPYTYEVVPTKLEEAVYEARVDLGAGVTCLRFSTHGQPLYLLWCDEGQRTLNLRELTGQVRVTDASGAESVLDAAALPLTQEPLFVERQ